MWTIEDDGDFFDGKTRWLVPGKKYLFGRTVSEDGHFAIADKSVSRQHLTIEVEVAGPDDCRNPKSRSKVILNDQKTKFGTTVNGEPIKGVEDYELKSEVNEIMIGRSKHLFRITWCPVALTFSFSTKELKANPLEALYATFGPLDVKVLTEYERDVTSHVVVKKRNTAKGLRALINGKHIVDNDPFIKAIIDATTPEPDGACSLEKDFKNNFPDAAQYLPERGTEPTDEPATSYAPDLSRQTMFDGYTFVFYDKAQFETLLAPITDGRGKALYREVTPVQTPVNDFVRYVKNVAGEKGVGEFEDGSEGKGVVVVGFYPIKGDGFEWFKDFASQVALALDQRLVLQSEFLDAILKTDASVLRRPLEVEMSGVVAPTSTPATYPNAGKPTEASAESHTILPPKDDSVATSKSNLAGTSSTAAALKDVVSQETQFRRGRSRRAVTSRFSGFDDDDDDDPPPAPVSLASIPEVMVVEQDLPEESQGLFVSQDPDREVQTYRAMSQSVEPEESSQPTRRSTRKRSAPPIAEEKSYMDSFAPTTASFKRQRRERGEPTPPPPVIKKEVVAPESAKKKEKKEVDIEALVAQQRERAEAAAQAEEKSLKQAVSTIDIEEMRKLTIVEDMEVKRSRPAPKTTRHIDEGDRWDDKWNGRKNFKKFRRRGAEDGPVRAHARVIVPLEEVKKRGNANDDDHWGLEGNDDTQLRRNKGKGKAKETQTQADTETPEAETPISSSRSKAKTNPKSKPQPREINSDNEDEELPENPMDARALSAEVEIVPESEDENQNGNEHRNGNGNEDDPGIFRSLTPASTGRSSRASTTQKDSLRGSGLSGTRRERDGSIGLGVGASGNKRAAASSLGKGTSVKRVRTGAGAGSGSGSGRRRVVEEEDEDRFVFR